MKPINHLRLASLWENIHLWQEFAARALEVDATQNVYSDRKGESMQRSAFITHFTDESQVLYKALHTDTELKDEGQAITALAKSV